MVRRRFSPLSCGSAGAPVETWSTERNQEHGPGGRAEPGEDPGSAA